MVTVITFGTFDLFHVDHLKLLERSKKWADTLIVGISSNELSFKENGKYPEYSCKDRMSIIKGLKCVDTVFMEESIDDKRKYIIEHSADILIMGDENKGKFDQLRDVCSVIYLSMDN